MWKIVIASCVWAATVGSIQAGGPRPGNSWVKVDEGRTGARLGSVLLYADDLRQMLLIGPVEGAPFVQAFDPAAKRWSPVTSAGPKLTGELRPYYQAAYDPVGKTVYCLSGGPVLYCFKVDDKTWKIHRPAEELEGLSWHTMACDPVSRRLVVVGADKKLENLGWSRTLIYGIATEKWSRLDVADEKLSTGHRERVAAKEAVIDLAGRIRLAWYRDPKGAGTDTEREELRTRAKALLKLPQMERFATNVETVVALLAEEKTLDALKATRTLQRKIEELTEEQYPVPCSRRNSPLTFDEKNRVFVLFGGDHEDYLMNDTWVLDLEKKAWRRASPAQAPSPRAGHALCGLPRQGGVVLYEGYVQSSSTDYGARPYTPLEPRQLWHFDPKTDRWDMLAHWPTARKPDPGTPAHLGTFEGYASDRFSPPALAAGPDDVLVLAAHVSPLRSGEGKRPCETWTMAVDAARADATGREKLAVVANQRLYRSEDFRASLGEVAERPKATGLDELPANRWVRLPPSPRNPCHGCRQRDWGTAVWDSDRDQILHWGGGHCVRSASTVVHYSPASGRTVEGFDADEPYGANGGGGFDSSLLNRPWVSTHNYNHYAYDPKCKLLVSGRGYLYDPDRMDWLRLEPIRLPYTFAWGACCVETSPHGAVAWAAKPNREDAGLWLFNRQQGWTDLKPKGTLFVPYCDSHGMVYDSRRDRMVLSGVGGGYAKLSGGLLMAFSFKTRALDTLTPENKELSKTHNGRELVYVDHADCILIGELYPTGEQPGKRYTRIYDCAKNRMYLLDAGQVPSGYSTGWMYDARRKLVYVFTFTGEAWALRLDPQTAVLLEAYQLSAERYSAAARG